MRTKICFALILHNVFNSFCSMKKIKKAFTWNWQSIAQSQRKLKTDKTHQKIKHLEIGVELSDLPFIFICIDGEFLPRKVNFLKRISARKWVKIIFYVKRLIESSWKKQSSKFHYKFQWKLVPKNCKN